MLLDGPGGERIFQRISPERANNAYAVDVVVLVAEVRERIDRKPLAEIVLLKSVSETEQQRSGAVTSK